MAPREVAWQSNETPSKAAGRNLRLLRLLRGAGNVPEWQFQSPIETGCGASEVPDSSFEGQQKQLVAPWEVSWQSSETPSKPARRVLRLLRLFKGCWKRARWQFQSPIKRSCGASEVPEGSFKGQQKQLVAPWEVSWQSSETPSKLARRVLKVLSLLRVVLKTCQMAVSEH